jgi:hypothetical protein
MCFSFPSETIWFWSGQVCGQTFNWKSDFFDWYRLLSLPTSFWVSLGSLSLLRTLLIHPSCQNYWHQYFKILLYYLFNSYGNYSDITYLSILFQILIFLCLSLTHSLVRGLLILLINQYWIHWIFLIIFQFPIHWFILFSFLSLLWV